MAVPLVPIALGGGVLGLLLLSRRNVVPGTPTQPNPPRPNGGGTSANFPPGNAQAVGRVNVTTGQGGLNLRTGASATAGLVKGYTNGTRIAVLGPAPSSDPAPIQWAQVMMQDGATGFARIIGPAGESNISVESGALPQADNRGGGEQPVVQGWGGYNPYSAMGGCGPCGGGGYGGPWGGWGPGLPYYYGNMEIAGRPARRGYR